MQRKIYQSSHNIQEELRLVSGLKAKDKRDNSNSQIIGITITILLSVFCALWVFTSVFELYFVLMLRNSQMSSLIKHISAIIMFLLIVQGGLFIYVASSLISEKKRKLFHTHYRLKKCVNKVIAGKSKTPTKQSIKKSSFRFWLFVIGKLIFPIAMITSSIFAMAYEEKSSESLIWINLFTSLFSLISLLNLIKTSLPKQKIMIVQNKKMIQIIADEWKRDARDVEIYFKIRHKEYNETKTTNLK